jgi:hypothetical protein
MGQADETRSYAAFEAEVLLQFEAHGSDENKLEEVQ